MARFALLTGLAAVLAGPAAVGWAAGFQLVVVEGGSMAPTYEWGDVIVIDTRARGLQPGEVVTVRRPTGVLYTHRIITVNSDATAITQGDANPITDGPPITEDDVVGTVTTHIPQPGARLLVATQSWLGRISLAVVTLGLVILPSFVRPNR